jgi:hypothetical protein
VATDTVLDRFSPAVKAWFATSFPAATPAQAEGFVHILGGSHTLISAPTGSGKALAWYDVRSHHLVTFAVTLEPHNCSAIVDALGALVKDGRAKNIEVRKINGAGVHDATPETVQMVALLEQYRFTRGYRGLVLRD